jgi:hypothetical protein
MSKPQGQGPRPQPDPPPAGWFRLPPMLSWQEFLDAAQAPQSIPNGDGRHGRNPAPGWAGARWDEALRLAVDGWPQPLAEVHLEIAELRERAGLGTAAITLEPVWDVTGAEVDMAAYLAGVPECMVDSVPRHVSRRGKVVTFLLPAGYSHKAEHAAIRHRGLALATLCSALIGAGHSVEIWSCFAGLVSTANKTRFSAAARVLSAGEPLDVGRLVFATAHPAMLRRLWFAVWDAQRAEVAKTLYDALYGTAPYTCESADLPPQISDPYIFPYLEAGDPQWRSLESALEWCRGMFADLWLIQRD